MIKLYNTFSRKKEEFISVKSGIVKIYSCGPTVYSFQHIGNLRAALCWDFLKRSFRYFKYDVIDVVNITDVGHLVSDSDNGEDKMLKAAKLEKKDPIEIARFYEKKYILDLNSLNIKPAKFMPRATEHIGEQIEMISELESGDYIYKTSDGIYFDVSKFSDYGKLSGQSLEEKQAGARVTLNSDKKNPQDFALWKFLTGDNTHHVMKWDSKWGVGFPGWHLECSAMSAKYLGKRFDIHTGGVEHISIHHENERAQNICSKKVEKVNFWMHNGHMLVNGEKMSKSIGNVYLVDDLIKKGYSPLALREICLRSHYRKQINFTFKSLDSGQNNVEKINNFYNKIKSLKVDSSTKNNVQKLYDEKISQFEMALNDDLNTPKALSSLDEFMSVINKINLFSKQDKDLILEFLDRTNEVFSLLEISEDKIPKKVLDLAMERSKVRAESNFKLSDEIRDEILSCGFEIKDDKSSKKGFLLKKLK